MRTGRIIFAVMAIFLLTTLIVIGQSVPQLINYQGRLLNASGQPLNGVNVNITFRFWSAPTGGTIYLTVLQQNVAVSGGVYNVLIGSGTIIPGAEASLTNVFQKHNDVYLGVAVNLDEEMTPRSRISTEPYAFRVDTKWLDQYINSCDYDMDGDSKFSCGGTDCDDGDPLAYLGAPEINCDGIDQDCDGKDSGTIAPSYSWTRRTGSYYWEWSSFSSVDVTGNVYYGTCYWSDPVNFAEDFGGSDIKYMAGGLADLAVTKINANGTYGWTKRFGGSGTDDISNLFLDQSGNIFITGYFENSVNFAEDFGGNDTKSSAGDNDAFITKINANGTYGWTKRIGGSSTDGGGGLFADQAGNVYISGRFQGTVNFAADFGGTDNKTSAGGTDLFVTKINSDTTYGWTKRFGGTAGESTDTVLLDSSGNIYLIGDFSGTVNFAADFGGNNNKTSAGGQDVFVTRINANLTYGWTKRLGGSGDEIVGSHCYLDSSGKIYISGGFNGTVNFAADFGSSDVKTSAGSRDIFLTQIYTSGTYGWTKKIGGSGDDLAYAVELDATGNIYLVGTFNSTINFAADFGGTDNKSAIGGGSNAFLTQINSDLTYGWTKIFGGSGGALGLGVSLDQSGKIYINGEFSSTANFAADFGGTDSKTSAGCTDAYITKINLQCQ